MSVNSSLALSPYFIFNVVIVEIVHQCLTKVKDTHTHVGWFVRGSVSLILCTVIRFSLKILELI